MRIRGRLTAIAIFAFMFIVALIIPATREVALTCSRIAIRSLSLAEDIGSNPAVFGVSSHPADMERTAAKHKDATILLGMATGGIKGYGDENIRILERAAELDPNSPAIRTALIQIAGNAPFDSEVALGTRRLKAAEAEKYIQVIEENARWGMKNDPDNAFFFFAIAYAQAIKGKMTEAKDLFVEASQKKHLDIYDKHILRARVKAEMANGGTQFGSRYQVWQSEFQGVHIITRLSLWTANEARKADMQGRKAEAIHLDLANFDTGSLIYEMTESSWSRPGGQSFMIRAFPAIEQTPTYMQMDERYARQASLLADHLLSHNVPQTRVDEVVARFREVSNTTEHFNPLLLRELYRAEESALASMALSGMLLGGAVAFGVLWLLMLPVTRLLAGRTRAEGWTTATSAVMWILLVTVTVSALLAFDKLAPARASIPMVLLSMLFPPGQPAVAMLAIIFTVTAILLVRQIVVDATSGREAKRAFGRSALLMGILIPEVLILLVVPANMEVQRVQLVIAVTVLCALIAFSLLRAAIDRRRAGGGFEEHFFPSLLASIRVFALGSAALGIVGIYVSVPFYYRAVEAVDRMLAG